MTLAQADEHQRKHGFAPLVKDFIERGQRAQAAVDFILHKEPVVMPSDRMTKTEREFSFMLEAQKRTGEIKDWFFEAITLHWPVGEKIISYTPDFLVFTLLTKKLLPMKLIEVKGGFTGGKFERAVERFRHAVTRWSQFEFEMHQKKDNTWKKLL